MTVHEDGWVRRVNLHPPSLRDNTADGDRLVNFLKQHLRTKQIIIDIRTLHELPFQLRAWEYGLRCVVVKDPYADQWFPAGISNPLEVDFITAA